MRPIDFCRSRCLEQRVQMEPHSAVMRSPLRDHNLFFATTLPDAIERLGFVQADPIRSPARAQDLILRHRVDGYRAGDLERQYASLDVEEDYLYAYGFLSKPVWQLLHPRKTPRLRTLEKKVLETVTRLGEAHPRVLEAHLGKRRVINAWGGYSKATTHALEWLHWRGLLRIARRENGIRVYHPAASPQPYRRRPIDCVLSLCVRAISRPRRKISAVRHCAPSRLGSTRQMLAGMIRSGELRKDSLTASAICRPPLIGPTTKRRVRCVFLRRSTRSSGTGRGSNTCGVGRTGSRRIPR